VLQSHWTRQLGFDIALRQRTQSAQSAITAKATVDAGGTTQTNAGAAGNDIFYSAQFATGGQPDRLRLRAPDAAGAEHTLTVSLK